MGLGPAYAEGPQRKQGVMRGGLDLRSLAQTIGRERA
jgi:hypothetical protein